MIASYGTGEMWKVTPVEDTQKYGAVDRPSVTGTHEGYGPYAINSLQLSRLPGRKISRGCYVLKKRLRIREILPGTLVSMAFKRSSASLSFLCAVFSSSMS